MCFWKIIGIEHHCITGEYISEQMKGYRPCRRPLSVHERDLHREGTSTIRSMSLRGPCGRKVPSLLLSYDRPKVWAFSWFICSSYIYIYIHSTYTVSLRTTQCDWSGEKKLWCDSRPNGKACPTTVWHVKWKGPDTLLLEPTKKKQKKKLPPAKKAFAQRKTWGPDNDSVPKLRKRPSCLEQGKPVRNLRLRSLWKTSAQRKKAASEKLQPPGKA